MGCRLSSSRLKGKSPLAMELIADRYRNGSGTPGSPAARVRRSFHEDSLERNSRPPRRPRDGWHFSDDGVPFLQAGERPRVWRAKRLISRLQADARHRSLTDGAAVAERRLLGRQLSGVVGGRRARVQPWLATGIKLRPILGEIVEFVRIASGVLVHCPCEVPRRADDLGARDPAIMSTRTTDVSIICTAAS